MGIVLALLFISYSCTYQLGLSQTGHGPTLNGTVITSDEVLVIATGVNSLLVAWWSSKATLVMRYSVFCSSLHAQVQTNKAEAEQNVEQFNDSAINSLSVNNRVPRTTYNCCVAEYSIDNSYSIVCKMATTLSAASQQGNMTNVNRTVGAAISLFVMLLITLLCTSILSLVAMRQRQDGKRIQKWFRTIIDQHHLESQHSLDMNHYDCHNIKGSEHNEPDAIYCAAADNEPDAIYCAGADEPDAIYCTAADNEPDAIYCSTDDIVTVAEEGLLSSDHSIETTECVAYGTNEAEDPNAPEDSNESDTRNSEIYEAIC